MTLYTFFSRCSRPLWSLYTSVHRVVMTLPPLWLIVAASCLPVFTATQHKPQSPLFCFPWLLTVDSRSVAHCCSLNIILGYSQWTPEWFKVLFCGYPTPTSFLRLSHTWSCCPAWSALSISPQVGHCSSRFGSIRTFTSVAIWCHCLNCQPPVSWWLYLMVLHLAPRCHLNTIILNVTLVLLYCWNCAKSITSLVSRATMCTIHGIVVLLKEKQCEYAKKKTLDSWQLHCLAG